jgi:urease accessory protein
MGVPAAALLLLTDGRFPAGGYAHSGGLEPLVGSGRVHDLATLEAFLAGRVATIGLMAAAFAAAAARAAAADDGARLRSLDEALDVRTPSPAQRATSRQLGRQLLRVASTIHPHPVYDHLDDRPHQPVVFGTACAVLGVPAHDAALGSLHETVAGPTAAAVRLLSLDPITTHRVLAGLGPMLDTLATQALAFGDDVDELPAAGAPLLDIAAQVHAVAPRRLFAS